MEYETEKDRLLFSLSEINEKIKKQKADILGSSSNEVILDNESDLQSNLSEEFNGDFDGNLDEIYINEDNNISFDIIASSSRPDNSQQKNNNNKKRDFNLRKRKKINYNVGFISKKLHKNKHVSINCMLLIRNII